MSAPNDLDLRNLHFDKFHPLDHQPWHSRCARFYGGRRYHTALIWRYKWLPAITGRRGRWQRNG